MGQSVLDGTYIDPETVLGNKQYPRIFAQPIYRSLNSEFSCCPLKRVSHKKINNTKIVKYPFNGPSYI